MWSLCLSLSISISLSLSQSLSLSHFLSLFPLSLCLLRMMTSGQDATLAILLSSCRSLSAVRRPPTTFFPPRFPTLCFDWQLELFCVAFLTVA